MTRVPFSRPVWLCSLAVVLMASACAGNPAATPAAAPAGSGSAALLAQIQAEVGDAACDGAQQCRTIAIGAKPCGGPDGYLAWSVKRSDEQRLRALALRHAAARKDENQQSGISSTCVIETNPGASCQRAVCTLGPRGQGSLPPNDN